MLDPPYRSGIGADERNGRPSTSRAPVIEKKRKREILGLKECGFVEKVGEGCLDIVGSLELLKPLLDN
jgi:hypothetical protein